MKKKPSLIFSILSNVLSNLDMNEEYSINEISEKAGLHWQTTNEYLRTMAHLLTFSPKIKINDNNKIQIIKHSEFFENLSISQKILITLYESKSFDEKSSIRIQNIMADFDLDISLEELAAKHQIKKYPTEDKYYITKQGKIIVISLYSEMTRQIYDIDNGSEDISQKEISNEDLEKLNIKFKTIISQNNEILMQNRIFMSFLQKLGTISTFSTTGKATESNLQDITLDEATSDINSIFQTSFSIKWILQRAQEFSFNIKTIDISSGYEYPESSNILQEIIKSKLNKKEGEVIAYENYTNK